MHNKKEKEASFGPSLIVWVSVLAISLCVAADKDEIEALITVQKSLQASELSILDLQKLLEIYTTETTPAISSSSEASQISSTFTSSSHSVTETTQTQTTKCVCFSQDSAWPSSFQSSEDLSNLSSATIYIKENSQLSAFSATTVSSSVDNTKSSQFTISLTALAPPDIKSSQTSTATSVLRPTLSKTAQKTIAHNIELYSGQSYLKKQHKFVPHNFTQNIADKLWGKRVDSVLTEMDAVLEDIYIYPMNVLLAEELDNITHTLNVLVVLGDYMPVIVQISDVYGLQQHSQETLNITLEDEKRIQILTDEAKRTRRVTIAVVVLSVLVLLIIVSIIAVGIIFREDFEKMSSLQRQETNVSTEESQTPVRGISIIEAIGGEIKIPRAKTNKSQIPGRKL